MKKIATEQNDEFLDFGGRLFDLLQESRKMGSSNELINADRVHPNIFGMSVMARVFLAAQGFIEADVNASMICDSSAEITLSDKAQEYHKFASLVQRFWSAEWLFLANFSAEKFARKNGLITLKQIIQMFKNAVNISQNWHLIIEPF